ncbi:MAG: hypothetical protein AAF203_01680 [Pseudomonadota bacterium]
MSNEKKCFVTTSGFESFLILFWGKDFQSEVARLPKWNEISEKWRKGGEVQEFHEFMVLVTAVQLAPWDALDPFPPDRYRDYTFLDFNDPQGAVSSVILEGKKIERRAYDCFPQSEKEFISHAIQEMNHLIPS